MTTFCSHFRCTMKSHSVFRGKEAGMAMVKGERGEELGGGKREGEDKRKDRRERWKGGGGRGGGEGREVEREDR